MGKKGLIDCRSKSGQITIFIIVGLLVLFIFIFLIQISTSMKKEQLNQAKENAFTKSFQKEALRIYVQDCLIDSLEEALILVGNQGRMWDDQMGGKKNFVEGSTGITAQLSEGNVRIAYGITKETNLNYLVNENSYPCDDKTNSSPEFCQYTYPNTNVGFGKLELPKSTIKNDLKRYLLDKTVWCVENYTRGEISSSAEIEPTEITMGMDLRDDGINVNVVYPLKFKVGKEEFFHISNFDFFYPTKFNQLLDSAVSFPLEWDYKFLDFSYTESSLMSPSFLYGSDKKFTTCEPFKNFFFCDRTLNYDKYKSLGIEMKKKSLANGDDIFVFTPASYTIINSPKTYQFRVARQNRPPALDYVNRYACPEAGYDYLVIADAPASGEEESQSYNEGEFPASSINHYSCGNENNDFYCGPESNLQSPENVLGLPNGVWYDLNISGEISDNLEDYASSIFSLGKFGTITLRFSETLTTDKTDNPDLLIVEDGKSPETYSLEISEDGIDWIFVGNHSEQINNIDLDQFVSEEVKFNYIKITDAGENNYVDDFPGVDIDAAVGLYQYLNPGTESGKNLGEIDIDLFALDPDEDKVEFNFNGLHPSWGFPLDSYENKSLFVEKSKITLPYYHFIANVTDEHGLSDWQEVRVLVDRPMEMGFDLSMPYTLFNGTDLFSYKELFYNKKYVVSNEDPVFVNVTLPEDSLLGIVSPNNFNPYVSFIYNSTNENFPLQIPYIYGASKEFCYNLPTNLGEQNPYKNCQISDYSDNDLEKWDQKLINNEFGFPHFKEITLNEPGKLRLKFSADYCNNLKTSKTETADIYVKECIPHYNPKHPFAYPYHGYEFALNDDNLTTDYNNLNSTDSEINPFLATHSCCQGNPQYPGTWKIKNASDEPCFVNPLPGCYGKIIGYTEENPGYLLEQEQRYCSGERGNYCEGNFSYNLYEQKMICGYNNNESYPNCDNIAAECQGKPFFSLIENVGWCHGQMGCRQICKSEIVYTSFSPTINFDSDFIYNIAKFLALKDENNLEFGFVCGCSGNEGICDLDFDGTFNGICDNGKCMEEICNPNKLTCDENGNIAKCSSAGTSYTVENSCPSGTACQGFGECVPVICTVGSDPLCYNGDIQSYFKQFYEDKSDDEKAEAEEAALDRVFQCNEKGTGYKIIKNCADDGLTCITSASTNAGQCG